MQGVYSDNKYMSPPPHQCICCWFYLVLLKGSILQPLNLKSSTALQFESYFKTLITTLKWNALPLRSSSFCYLQLPRASSISMTTENLSGRGTIIMLCIFHIVCCPVRTPKILICILISSPHHLVVDSELDACAGWNSGFLVSITWFNACNCKKKTQFGDRYVVLYLNSSFL